MTFFAVQHTVVLYVRDLFCPFRFIGPCLNEYFNLQTFTQAAAPVKGHFITLNPHLPPLQV